MLGVEVFCLWRVVFRRYASRRNKHNIILFLALSGEVLACITTQRQTPKTEEKIFKRKQSHKVFNLKGLKQHVLCMHLHTISPPSFTVTLIMIII